MDALGSPDVDLDARIVGGTDEDSDADDTGSRPHSSSARPLADRLAVEEAGQEFVIAESGPAGLALPRDDQVERGNDVEALLAFSGRHDQIARAIVVDAGVSVSICVRALSAIGGGELGDLVRLRDFGHWLIQPERQTVSGIGF